MKLVSRIRILALFAAFFGAATTLLADPTHNPPLVCAARASCSSCPQPDGCACGCILVTLDLGTTTAWTGQTPVYLRIHSSDETASLSTPAQLKVVMGWSFKAVDGGTTAGGAPQIVRFVQPEGAELVVHFQDGDSVGVPEPNNLGKSLARVQMVDAEGWATTSAPAFYDLYPGDGSVWRFLATGNTNERGALVSFTDPRGRVLTTDDFGVDIVRDSLGNIRQVKTLTRLADVRTLSPTHYAVTVYPLAEEPEQVADTGLYALPEHAPTRVLDVAQGESVKELLVGFQKGTGDMRQYRYVAVNGDWTLHQPSGLVEAQELYFTEDESGAQRLHTIRDETGKLWSRDEYNYVSAYWGYLITNRIEGIPGDATRTTSWSYYTDGPHKDLLRETVEPTGNRIVYEYDDKNRVVRESMPLVEEETLYSYEPVDPSDPPLLCDTRPRCVVRKMQGIEIQRTYYVYGTNGMDVVERVGEQGAAYGGTNVLRTVTTYYPVTGAITDGLVQSVRHEDGTIDNYAYDLANGVWTETITHVHEQAPNIIPMKTVRNVSSYSNSGRLIATRSDIFATNSVYVTIDNYSFEYDIEGNLLKVEDQLGRSQQFFWDGACCGKTSEQDWDGLVSVYSYDIDGNVTERQVHADSLISYIFTYDPLNRQTSVAITNREDFVGEVLMECRYDSLGRIIDISEQNETPRTRQYSADGLIISEISSQNLVSLSRYNQKGEKIEWRNGNEHVIVTNRIVENGSREVSYYYENENIVLVHSYNMLNQLEWISEPGFDGKRVSTNYRYNQYGKLAYEKMSGRPCLMYGYNPVVGNETVAAFAGNETRTRTTSHYFEETEGKIWKIDKVELDCSDPTITPVVMARKEQMTGFAPHEYARVLNIDKYGKVSEETLCRETTTGILLNETKDCFGNTTSRWSTNGHLVANADHLSETNSIVYDPLGRISKIMKNGNLGRWLSYGKHDYSSSEINRYGGVTVSTYDRLGNLLRRTYPDHQTDIFLYDELGRLVFLDGRHYPVQYEYASNGRVSTVGVFPENDGVSDFSRYLFDAGLPLVIEHQFPNGTVEHFEYTDSGAMKKHTRPDGSFVVCEYDEWGALRKRIASSNPESPILWHYDSMGRLTNMVDALGTTTYSYDCHGDELIVATPFHRLEYIRDSFGRIVETRDSVAGTNWYQYSATSRTPSLVRAEGFSGSISTGKTNILVATTSQGMMTSVSYASTNVSYAKYQSTGGVNEEFSWIMDPCGNRLAEFFTDSNSNCWTNLFLYGPRSELTNAVIRGKLYCYDYDNAGTRRSSSTPETRFEYVPTTGQQFSFVIASNLVDGSVSRYFPKYDLNGNLTNVWTTTGFWEVEFDENNKPSCWKGSGIEVQFAYDGNGRLAQRRLLLDGIVECVDNYGYRKEQLIFIDRKTKDGGTTTTRILWNNPESIAQSPIAFSCEDAEWSLFVKDEHMRIVGEIHMEQSFHYDWTPFMASKNYQRAESLPSGLNSLFDPLLGVHLFTYRTYNPLMGQWLSQDPLGQDVVFSLPYAYCDNNPISNIDIAGLQSLSLEECNTAVNQAWGRSSLIRNLVSKFKTTNCLEPIVSCKCCLETVNFGLTLFGEHLGNRIGLCYNNRENVDELYETYYHELVHHWNGCNDIDSHFSDFCERHMCDEILAYYYADLFDIIDHNPDGTIKWDEVIIRAAGSARDKCVSSEDPTGDFPARKAGWRILKKCLEEMPKAR